MGRNMKIALCLGVLVLAMGPQAFAAKPGQKPEWELRGERLGYSSEGINWCLGFSPWTASATTS